MSRHRAVRNLDLDDELYDDDDGVLYDEMQDISEEDQERLNSCLRTVRKELGPNTGIDDQEIKESLWYYYFDEAATIAYLVKTHKLKPKNHQEHLLETARHRPGNPPLARIRQDPQQSAAADPKPRAPSLAGLASRSSAASSGLASLRSPGGSSLKALATPASAFNSSGSGSGSISGLSRLSLGSLGSTRPFGLKNTDTGSNSGTDNGPIKTTTTTTTTTTTNVVGKALAALKARPSQPAVRGSIGSSIGTRQSGNASSTGGIGALQSISLSQLSSRPGIHKVQAGKPPLKPALEVASPVSAKPSRLPAVQNAQPSSLASFILDDDKTRHTGPPSRTRFAVVDGIKQEISHILFSTGHSGSGASKGRVSGDLTFIRQLVVDAAASESVKPFAFDTPSPDDRVLAAQSRAVGASF